MSMSAKTKAKGMRGSWFATVDGFGRLPCAHQDMTTTTREGMTYRDELSMAHPQTGYVEALGDGLVVLTSDHVDRRPGQPPAYRRSGYIGVFRIADLDIKGGVITFRFTQRVADAK